MGETECGTNNASKGCMTNTCTILVTLPLLYVIRALTARSVSVPSTESTGTRLPPDNLTLEEKTK
jgi:hypothetical protein